MGKIFPVDTNAFGSPEEVHRETILVVDDRPANLKVYRSILEELGQNLITAGSGEEALKLVLRHDFAVILLDVNMPTLNGFDTAALIRQRRKSATTPIIFLTAFTDEVSISQGYASGAVDFMPTPVVPEVLKAKVRVFIELSQMRRQAAMQAEERARREAAEAAARHQAFLAQVSEHLARAHTREDFTSALAHLPVPHLAEAALVWFKHDGRPDHIEWASAEGGLMASPAMLDKLDNAVERVLADARPVLANGGAGAMAYAQILPLTVQGQAHGVLVLGARQPLMAIDPTAIEVAYRASVVLENVMLMERIREADRRKDEFLGMLAHELRNPLAPIINCLQLQKMIPAGDARMAGIRETMDRQVRHMGRLIDDLLDATRLAHGKILLRKERGNLNTIIHQTVEDYRNVIADSGLQLETDLPSEPVLVDGDPTRLVQSLGNLLHNAHKFSNPGGTIKVRLRLQGRMAEVTVTDTGIGIDPPMLGHVFDVFRQVEQGLDRSRGGLGLGLALVKGLVHLHGGEVEAHSAGLGEGAEFVMRLPLAAGEAAAEVPVPGSKGKKSVRRILVIEDNRDAAESIGLLLQCEGHQVDIAFSGQEGLEKARQSHPEIIVCDIGLPVMDGYQIIRRVRESEALADTFAIALTAYGRDEDQLKALEAGFDLHMTKPIDHEILFAALEAGRTGGRVVMAAPGVTT